MEMLENFPLIDWKVNPETIITSQDFTIVYQLEKEWFEVNGLEYDYYELKSGQTIEDIAQAMYEDPKMYWVICVANRITDLKAEWFLTDNQLLNFVFDKYYLKIFNEDGIWDDELSAILTFEYIRHFGNVQNDYYFEPLNAFDENGNPIKLLPHHFETKDGDWVPAGVAGSTPVSFLEFENQENLKRRFIRLPDRELASLMKKNINDI